jgi:hypothetical protein
VEYDEIKEDGASKRKNADYNARMKAVRALRSHPVAVDSDSAGTTI